MKNICKLAVPVMAAFVALTFASCLPPAEDDDIVITYRAPNVDYTANKLYALPDSVVLIGDQSSSSTVGNTYEQIILTKIAENMATMGYTRVYHPDSADVTILPTVIYSTSQYDAYSDYNLDPYWGWYDPDWFDPDFDWSIDFGWETDEVFTFSTGTLFIQMIDKKNPNLNTKKYSSIWAALINGVLTTANLQTNLVRDINQAWDQSQYLKTN